jgi:Fe2+ or Zn2+ uptake regulation protein
MSETTLAERLRSLGLVPTIQRLAVLDYLDKAQNHPTAEEVYQGVRRRYPSIAKATVYNVLDALKEAGAIQQLTITRDAAHYDAVTEPHPHFLCRACGTLIDVELPCPIRPGDKILGHLVESVNTYLYGLCNACQTTPGENEKDS